MYMMNHRIRYQSAGRYIGRDSSQSAGTARDRGRTVGPTTDRRSGPAAAARTQPTISDGGALGAIAEVAEPIVVAKAVHKTSVVAPKPKPPGRLGGDPLALPKTAFPKPPPPTLSSGDDPDEARAEAAR